ncbi:MAG: HAD-IB family hydrolase [Actinomadura rubrobrunea]|nr:HAD-IB family hydrolase [Actinomadura rubrobrunea]
MSVGGGTVTEALRRAAFFDVDETLINVTSIFSFLRYDMAVRGRPAADFRRAMDELAELRAAGASRVETNRAFYRNFAGRDVREVARRGREWFNRCRAEGGLFNEEVLATLRWHSAEGHLIVLVSGSFPACLEPIADFVSADLVLCSRPEIRDGRYTGELAEPMIGERKRQAVIRAAGERGIALDRSYAYGDNISDLPLLESVGHPVVVGGDPGLRARFGRTSALLGRLSDREMEVLELIARGRSNRGICRALRLRPKTVEAHVRSLFTKLGLDNRMDEHRRVMAAITYFGHDVRRHFDIDSLTMEGSRS